VSYTNRFGIEVYHDTDELIKDVGEDNNDMDYNDEHYQGTKIAYDGKLLPIEDAMARHDRDRGLSEKYAAAEKQVDEEQMTWTEVEETLHPKGRNHF